MILGEQVRAARTLLGWTPAELARAAFLKLDTIEWIESGPGMKSLDLGQELAIRRTLERAGIEFIIIEGRMRGVRHRQSTASDDQVKSPT